MICFFYPLNFKVYNHLWKLDYSFIHIYDSYQTENKICEISINSIKSSIYIDPNVRFRNKTLKTKTKYLCKFHLITHKHEYHCGVVNDEENRKFSLQMASDFYNMFKLVYLSKSKSSNKQFFFIYLETLFLKV